jgi:transposase
MDVHKHFSQVTACDTSGKVVFRQHLPHVDREVLRREFKSWPAGTPVILEGTFGWGWMTDELLACGLDPHLTSGAKTKGFRQSKGKAKNNRLDADLLSDLWREPEKWWKVWLAPPEVRQQREWLRYRMGLVKMQTTLKNRVQAVLHRHGVLHPHSDLFGQQGRVLLAELMKAEDPRVPASAKANLEGLLQLLEDVRLPLGKVTREVHSQIKKETDASYWKTLPGIGWILGYTIQAEIGDLQRFKNSGCLAAYSLLAPRDDDSGEEDPQKIPAGRHVGIVGRRTLKAAFLLAAQSATKKSPRLKALFDRITDQGKRNRMRGYMAVAHKLCDIGYSCVKHKRAYSENPPERSGGKATRENSHSAAG